LTKHINVELANQTLTSLLQIGGEKVGRLVTVLFSGSGVIQQSAVIIATTNQAAPIQPRHILIGCELKDGRYVLYPNEVFSACDKACKWNGVRVALPTDLIPRILSNA